MAFRHCDRLVSSATLMSPLRELALKERDAVVIAITELDNEALVRDLAALADILVGSVVAGAAIGFVLPLSHEEASRFWSDEIGKAIVQGERVLFGARLGQRLVGTVQLVTACPRNQFHRCEIAKMMVHPEMRRRGIGRMLMNAALERARHMGKTLVTLDTRSGDVAQGLYASLGFDVAGEIPDYAWNPDRQALHATTYMFRRL